MQLCVNCNTQPGFPHKAECVRPKFTGEPDPKTSTRIPKHAKAEDIITCVGCNLPGWVGYMFGSNPDGWRCTLCAAEHIRSKRNTKTENRSKSF